MIDRIFAPVLALCVLAGGTLAVGSAWFDSRSTVQTLHLPTVNVVVVRLPSVEVVGRRAPPPVSLAHSEVGASDAAPTHRVQ